MMKICRHFYCGQRGVCSRSPIHKQIWGLQEATETQICSASKLEFKELSKLVAFSKACRPLIFCQLSPPHTMRLFSDCWHASYLAPGGGHPLDTGLLVTVLSVHGALGHLDTSLVWHRDRAAFCCQSLTCHSPCLDASTTAPRAWRPWSYHPSVRERQGSQGAHTCCECAPWGIISANQSLCAGPEKGSNSLVHLGQDPGKCWVPQPPILVTENFL